MTARIAVIGTGYVGLTAGAHLARLGHRVVCADVVPDKVEQLGRGEVPIVEAGLEDLVRQGLANGRLSFVLGARAAVPDAEFVFLCLPTPQGEDGRADTAVLEAAVAEIRDVLEPETVVVNKSTVPVGFTRRTQQAIGRNDVFVVSNPEFVREGSAVHDCLHPDRIVIGADDTTAAMRLARLYEGVDAPVMITDPSSAETVKYASNAFLATKVSFVNAVADLCEAVGADVRDVALGMGYDRRIGFEYLRPGPGWGGSCFPKDTRALLRIAEDHDFDFTLLRGVVDANEAQYDRVAAKVERLAGGLAGGVVAVWGLTFKARTDDLRDSPALAVIERLRARGARVRAFDPTRCDPIEGIEVVADPYAACEGASVLAVLTEWDEFRWLDFAKVASLMDRPAVVDARNLLDPVAMRASGFAYDAIGRR
jgi:UDPglucose 6-dehydrogenase